MKNFLNKFKSLIMKLKNTDAITKFLLMLSVIFIGIMVVYMVGQIHHTHLFHQRERYGNERWQQVDEILQGYEDRIEQIETQIEALQ